MKAGAGSPSRKLSGTNTSRNCTLQVAVPPIATKSWSSLSLMPSQPAWMIAITRLGVSEPGTSTWNIVPK